jgi:MFS family permease
MGGLALGLGILTVGGLVQLWQVYVFAFLVGCVTAFDATARQTFVSDLVGEADLSNAVALNSTSFNAAPMIGPAIAGFKMFRCLEGALQFGHCKSYLGQRARRDALLTTQSR